VAHRSAYICWQVRPARFALDWLQRFKAGRNSTVQFTVVGAQIWTIAFAAVHVQFALPTVHNWSFLESLFGHPLARRPLVQQSTQPIASLPTLARPVPPQNVDTESIVPSGHSASTCQRSPSFSTTQNIGVMDAISTTFISLRDNLRGRRRSALSLCKGDTAAPFMLGLIKRGIGTGGKAI
jgi:hypothetical protein